jgi:hypothetical protein
MVQLALEPLLECQARCHGGRAAALSCLLCRFAFLVKSGSFRSFLELEVALFVGRDYGPPTKEKEMDDLVGVLLGATR